MVTPEEQGQNSGRDGCELSVRPICAVPAGGQKMQQICS